MFNSINNAKDFFINSGYLEMVAEEDFDAVVEALYRKVKTEEDIANVMENFI